MPKANASHRAPFESEKPSSITFEGRCEPHSPSIWCSGAASSASCESRPTAENFELDPFPCCVSGKVAYRVQGLTGGQMTRLGTDKISIRNFIEKAKRSTWAGFPSFMLAFTGRFSVIWRLLN
jgi:hypothetical protein